MGVVWAATDREHKRSYAVKLLRSGGGAAARKQLLERARAALSLRHPGIGAVLEVGSDGNRDFVVMELIEGECVADWLASQPAQREVIAAMLEAGRALEAAHRASVIHRNFKLHNVLRGADGRIRVVDFGLARGQLEGKAQPSLSAVGVAAGGDLEGERPPPRNQHAVLDASLTQGGVYVGTPGYLAPELWGGAPADKRSDQFAFAVATWEALLGKRPFTGDTLEELQAAVKRGVPAGEGAELPAGLRAALVRALEPEPAKRWPDLSSLLDAIARAGAPRSRSLVMAGAGAVALASLVAIFFVVRGRQGGGEPVALPVEPTLAAAAGGECPPAEQVFGEVWSSARRARLAERAADAAVADALAQLDAAKAQWIEAYTEACAMTDLAASERQRACLMLARERTDAAIGQLEAPGAEPELLGVAELAPTIAGCRR
jgi:hypothetical protein